MSETLYTILKEHNKIRSISGKVFDIDASELRHAWDKTTEKAKVEDAHFHDCRHTFCMRLAQQGIDLYTMKTLSGHESIKTTERYAHHCPSSLRPSVRAVDDYNNITTAEAVND